MNPLLGRRLLAYLADELLISLIIVLPLEAFLPKSRTLPLLAAGASQIFALLYWSLLETFTGESFGKGLFSLKVVIPHSKLSFGRAVLRSLPKAIPPLLFLDSLPLFVGRRDERFTDSLLGSRVIDWKTRKSRWQG